MVWRQTLRSALLVLLKCQLSDILCTAEEYFERVASISCTEHFLQPTIDRLTGDCTLYARLLQEPCGIDKSGKPCYEKFIELTSQFSAAISACQGTDTTMCNAACVETLGNVSRSSGCCLNNFFNGSVTELSGISYDWLSDTYWSQCGLDSPGFCENGAMAFKAPRIVAGLALLLLICYIM